jgi:hypothetical protein
MYTLIENDVRLLRRILVARQLGEFRDAQKIANYLRKKGMRFKLPNEQDEEERGRMVSRLPDNERWLVEAYGCVVLYGPKYTELIFLNSKWVNPYTLYVRLVEPVPELRMLGSKYWIPDKLGLEEQFREEAEAAHVRYRERYPYQPQRVVPWIQKAMGALRKVTQRDIKPNKE